MRLRNMTIAALMALCAGQVWALDSVMSGYWTNSATWGSSVPTSADDVVIKTGHTVTIADKLTHEVKSLTIQSGGMLTHSANASTEAYKVILNIADNLTVAAGGSIEVIQKGYAVNSGPYTPSTKGMGASHGGRGGGGQHSDSPTYGSVVAPTNIGTGNKCCNGGPGGGAIRLIVAGNSVIDGMLNANAGGAYDVPVGGDMRAGASGGSVYLTTGTLSGSGTIQADGKATNGGDEGSPGGGGGGRIAIILNGGNSFGSVAIHAYGGRCAGNRNGGAGTVYLQTQTQGAGNGTLIIDNNDRLAVDFTRWTGATDIPAGQTWDTNSFDTLIVTNGAMIGLGTNSTLNLSGLTFIDDDSDQKDGFYLYGGTLVPSANPYAFDCRIWLASAATFDPARPVIVQSTGILHVDASNTFSGDLTVQSNGLVTHTPHAYTEAFKVFLNVAGNLTIDAGGLIDVGSRGIAYGNGGWPFMPTTKAMGASHGGQGGRSSSSSTYGSITAPTTLGSGNYCCYGGPGGGAIRLIVTGNSVINGMLNANAGGTLVGNGGRAGASGGSVYVTTGTLSGSGTIQADGKATNGGDEGGSGGGGGGRIAIILTNENEFGNVVIHAYGGASPQENGAAGTVYLQTRTQGPGGGTLLIDAANLACTTASTLIGSNITDTTVGTVIITNKARLAVSNQTLTVQGNWENKATFIAMTNSTINFAGASAATIWTNNAFFNLTCTNAGKTLVFEAGRTNTVAGLLKLGASQPGQRVTLQSTMDGSWSYLTLVPGGAQQITRVSVKDSNAGGGQTLLANVGSANGGNNINWQFPPSGTMFMVK